MLRAVMTWFVFPCYLHRIRPANDSGIIEYLAGRPQKASVVNNTSFGAITESCPQSLSGGISILN